MNHAARVTKYNAQLKRVTGEFCVIETATGRTIGKPGSYAFSKHVRDTRDAFNAGAFLVKRSKEQVMQTTKEQVRAYLNQRVADHTPPPEPNDIRRQLGWGLIEAQRGVDLDDLPAILKPQASIW